MDSDKDNYLEALMDIVRKSPGVFTKENLVTELVRYSRKLGWDGMGHENAENYIDRAINESKIYSRTQKSVGFPRGKEVYYPN